jgi:hypothetical protein
VPGRGVHLIVFDLVAFSWHLGLAIQAIQNSRSWKVIKALSYVRSKVL